MNLLELLKFERTLTSVNKKCVGGVKVSMVAFQAIDPGSIPGRRKQHFTEKSEWFNFIQMVIKHSDVITNVYLYYRFFSMIHCDIYSLLEYLRKVLILQFHHNGPFLTVNQSMFTEVEVANQWHCSAQNNLCPTLHKRISFLFVIKLVSS